MTGSSLRRLSAAVVLAFAIHAPAAAQAAPVEPEVLAAHGFGDEQNSYAWSMQWFKGKLYVGTGRNVMCVEAATSQFYFSFTTFYQTDPAPNVHCPADPFDMDLRAEIWRYTPSTDRWKMVYQAPADIPNPRARGKFLARDIAYRGMEVVRDERGREALFVSGVTANEYVPEIARKHPPRLLRTYDGKRFHDVSVPLIVNRSGDFPDRRPIGYRGLEVWKDRLYVVASTALTGDGAVFEVRDAFARKARFRQMTPTDMHVFELQRFDGDLYVGTGSFEDGYGVYKAEEPGKSPDFEPVVTGGAGMGGKMVSVVSMHPWRGQLYVGGVSWYSAELRELPASELIRIDRKGAWDVVTGDARLADDGTLRTPISGLEAGFANIFNSHLWRMVDRDGTLFVGTLDWNWLLQDNEGWAGDFAGLINSTLAGTVGFDLWASCDGAEWFPVTTSAFNDDPFDFGVRSLEAGPKGFYIGSANHAFGTRIWHEERSFCDAARGGDAARAPRHVLTDAQRDGTVVSWSPSARAASYRVERAEYTDAPFSVLPPARPAGGGLDPESGLPRPTPRGTPGSVALRAPVRGAFVPVGTTARPYFVDRTRRPGSAVRVPGRRRRGGRRGVHAVERAGRARPAAARDVGAARRPRPGLRGSHRGGADAARPPGPDVRRRRGPAAGAAARAAPALRASRRRHGGGPLRVRVTLLTVGSRGDVQPLVALGAGLQRAGHEVRLATHSRFASAGRPARARLRAARGGPREPGRGDRGGPALDRRPQPPPPRRRRLPARRALRRARAPGRRRAGVRRTPTRSWRPTSPWCWAGRWPAPGGVPLVRAYVEPPAWMITRRSTRRLAPAVRQAAWLAARPWLNGVRRDALGWGPLPRREPLADLDRRRALALFAYSPAVLPPPPGLGDWFATTGYWFLEGTADPAPPPALADFLAAGPPPVSVGFGTMIDTDPAATVALVADALARAGQRGVLIGEPQPAGDLPPHLLATGPVDHELAVRALRGRRALRLGGHDRRRPARRDPVRDDPAHDRPVPLGPPPARAGRRPGADPAPRPRARGPRRGDPRRDRRRRPARPRRRAGRADPCRGRRRPRRRGLRAPRRGATLPPPVRSHPGLVGAIHATDRPPCADLDRRPAGRRRACCRAGDRDRHAGHARQGQQAALRARRPRAADRRAAAVGAHADRTRGLQDELRRAREALHTSRPRSSTSARAAAGSARARCWSRSRRRTASATSRSRSTSTCTRRSGSSPWPSCSAGGSCPAR